MSRLGSSSCHHRGSLSLRLSQKSGRIVFSQSRTNLIFASRAFSVTASTEKERLVILGSGWGGYEVLRGIDKKRWDVTVLSPSNYFNFTPLLASCAVGTLEFRCAVEPVIRYSPQVTSYKAWCDSIDFKKKTLKCVPATPVLTEDEGKSARSHRSSDQPASDVHTSFEIQYDKLVISVGAYAQTFGVPGVKEHAQFLKDVADARNIRMRVLERFEQARQPTVSEEERKRLLHFCIVGGGPTGTELAAELQDLIQSDIKRHYPTLAPLAQITIYDVAPNILGSFDQSLVQYAEKIFKREGIQILTSHNVERVEADKMFVKEQGEVPFGILVWSTGLAPNPLVAAITEAVKDPKTNSLITDDHLNMIMKDTEAPNPDVWAIGDAAITKDMILPATAQVANQKARYVVKKLNAMARSKEHKEPFKFLNLGSLAYIGGWRAIYDRSSAKTGPKTKETGRLAWLLWRSAYFTMTLSARNRILVPTYWFLNWIFGRDLTRF